MTQLISILCLIVANLKHANQNPLEAEFFYCKLLPKMLVITAFLFAVQQIRAFMIDCGAVSVIRVYSVC